MNDPSKLMKKLYKEFCAQHESIMINLLAQAYKEGYNNCVKEVNSERKLIGSLREGGKDE